MKKVVISNEYLGFFDELKEKHDVCFFIDEESKKYNNDSALILNNPTLLDLCNKCCDFESNRKLIILVNNEKYHLYRALFPFWSIVNYPSSSVADEITNSFFGKNQFKLGKFTHREERFLFELSNGLSMKEVGFSMKISDRTTRRIKEKLLDKTGLLSLQQLIVFSLMREIIKTRSSGMHEGKE